jgi:hypothetical protein
MRENKNHNNLPIEQLTESKKNFGEELEDTKWVIKSRKSKKNGPYNSKKKRTKKQKKIVKL